VRLNSAARDVAFECLTHTIESNQLQSVVIEQAAVTEHGDTATLYRPRSDPGSLVASIDPALGGKEGEPVRAVRLSDYITAPVDFLKIDIEGAEPGVVRDLVNGGAIKWIRETVIEYHHREPQADALGRMAEALRAAGFDVRVQPVDDRLTMVRARRANQAGALAAGRSCLLR